MDQPSFEILAQLVSGGGVVALSMIVWFELRAVRREMREDRAEQTAAIVAMTTAVATTSRSLARIDERTEALRDVALVTEETGRRRLATPARGRRYRRPGTTDPTE